MNSKNKTSLKFTIKHGATSTLLVASLLTISAAESARGAMDDSTYANFLNPPDSTKPGIYWYWMNENVSKEGISKDLEALYEKGIGEVFIGNICWGDPTGSVKTLSEEWVECMRHAIREGTRIGIKIGAFNCPGWSQSGGPWIKKEDAMRYLVYSEVEVEGPARISQPIPPPAEFFQDVSVLAYPLLLENTPHQAISSAPKGNHIEHLTDSDLSTGTGFSNQANEPIQIDLQYTRPTTKRSLYIKPGDQPFSMTCEVWVKQDHEFKLARSHTFDRLSREVRMGAEPSAPLALSVGELKSDAFRIIMKNVPEQFEVRELDLSNNPILENYPEKWLTKMPSTALPDWFAYTWPDQEQPSNAGVITQKQILNLSSHLAGDSVNWEVPDGKWKILRIGMTTTKTFNKPAAPNAKGLEIDKMLKRPIEDHYNAYIGRIIKGMSKDDLKSFSRVIADSYETGAQNWTDGFDEIFVEKYGYDPLPWLAMLTGQIVGSAEESNRFLWDLRRLVAERIASEYVGGMTEVVEKNGQSLWLENYGWDGFPSEFLLYSKYSPAVGGEFWTGTAHGIENRLASSGCSTYGKNKVYAESYTTINNSFWYYPGNLKKYGDQSYADGINHHILHLCIHQPYNDKAPGVNAWFGIEYNRNNTWFEQSKSWIDYQRRCGFMLQQGNPAPEVCFFIGEDTPKMRGWMDESLAKGYDYDFINSDVIENMIDVKDGRLVLPSGVSYSLMVLPPLDTMRPSVLKRIKELVSQGANLLGSPIEKSPSLADYPQCDQDVQLLSEAIWGQSDYNAKNVIERTVGKGKVFCNLPINTVLQKIGAPEAVTVNSGTQILWKQRKLDEGSIYFVSNPTDSPVNTDIAFNITGYVPEVWNAVDGTKRLAHGSNVANGKTIIPFTLDEYESAFVVFQKKGEAPKDTTPQEERLLATLDNTWDIDFFNRWTNERIELKQHALENWAESEDAKLRHFSGTITYQNHFMLDGPVPDKNAYLIFENLHEVASVSINGHPLNRELWCKSFRIDLAPYLKEGENQVEVKVSNSWRNKIMEQEKKPAAEREISYSYYKGRDGLSPSGIWGNVVLKAIE